MVNIIYLISHGDNKITTISLHFNIIYLKNILTGETKSCRLNGRLLIVMPARSVSKQARLTCVLV